MDLSFENENKVHGNETCEIYMNGVIMEEMEESFEYNPSVKTKPRKNPRIEEKIMTTNIKKLHAQRVFWKLHNIILCWDFYCVNDNQDIDVEHAQIMYCIFCYNDLFNAFNKKTQARKGLLSYYKTN